MKKDMFWLLGAIVMACGITGCSTNTEIIAHRGSSYLAPENTMSAIQLAWQQEVDVEIDIYLAKDKQIVVIHDKTTEHITGTNLSVANTSSKELRLLDYGRFKGEKFVGEKIPFIEEVLASIPPERKLYIEIKCGAEVIPYLWRAIVGSNKRSQIVLIGFDLETMTACKKTMPTIPMYWLRSTAKDKTTKADLPHDPQWVQTATDNGLDGLDVHYAGVTPEFMEAVKAAEQKLYIWTVDDPTEARRLAKLGVTGITTNRPDELRDWLSE